MAIPVRNHQQLAVNDQQSATDYRLRTTDNPSTLRYLSAVHAGRMARQAGAGQVYNPSAPPGASP
ncbi:MAG: hypothetical protein J3T61_11905, partial [Candidatus Brocadiales bacterium]|nr:hypothetical protein [Candidatus Bathyanammoxibius sp.]